MPEYPAWAITTWLKFEFRLRIIICYLAFAGMILCPRWWV